MGPCSTEKLWGILYGIQSREFQSQGVAAAKFAREFEPMLYREGAGYILYEIQSRQFQSQGVAAANFVRDSEHLLKRECTAVYTQQWELEFPHQKQGLRCLVDEQNRKFAEIVLKLTNRIMRAS
jgi:hypothetical protein